MDVQNLALLQHLSDPSHASFEAAWKAFILELPILAPLVNEQARASVVAAVENWQGSGFGQSQLALLLFQWTGVKLLSSDFGKYRDIVAAALALFYGSSAPPKDLVGDDLQAAFALASLLTGAPSLALRPWSCLVPGLGARSVASPINTGAVFLRWSPTVAATMLDDLSRK
jgi:hypothetical protein